MRHRRRGFTLIELLVAIAIIGALIAKTAGFAEPVNGPGGNQLIANLTTMSYGNENGIDFAGGRWVNGIGNSPEEYAEVHLQTLRSLHPGGVNGCPLDGSVHFVSDSVEIRVWRALGTKVERETETADF